MTLESVPRSDVCDYLLESAETEDEGKNEKPNNEKEDSKAEAKTKTSTRSSLVIFAIDISGSMNTTTTVPDLQGLHGY